MNVLSFARVSVNVRICPQRVSVSVPICPQCVSVSVGICLQPKALVELLCPVLTA